MTINELTKKVLEIAKVKADSMPIGTYSRLNIYGEISDIVISPSSSGVYFYNVPGTITENILNQQIGFIYYSKL